MKWLLKMGSCKRVNKREKTGLRHYDDSEGFIEYSNNMQDLYKSIEEYNPGKSAKC